MNQREEARGRNREYSHRLGGAVNGGAPLGAEQKQDRGDQCPRVRDTDPENEVGDIELPPFAYLLLTYVKMSIIGGSFIQSEVNHG